MFRQGQLAVHGLAILIGRNEAGISNRGKIFLHHAVVGGAQIWLIFYMVMRQDVKLPQVDLIWRSIDVEQSY